MSVLLSVFLFLQLFLAWYSSQSPTLHATKIWDCTKLTVCKWELYPKKNCPWTHVLQTIRQLRKHQPAIFGYCTNSGKELHELDTFGISLLKVLSLRHVI